MKTIIISGDADKTAKVARELDCDYFVVDVAKYAELSAAVMKIFDKYGQIDYLINNAGVWI